MLSFGCFIAMTVALMEGDLKMASFWTGCGIFFAIGEVLFRKPR